MKRITTLGLSLLAVSAAASAQPPQAAEEGPGGPHDRRPPHGLLSADADGDGQVTREEFKQHHETLFKEADANGDGQLDRDEVLAIPRLRHGSESGIPPAPNPEWRSGKRSDGFGRGNPERFFSTLDANDDGKLQRDELPEALAAHADRLDTDKDGAISVDELKQAKPDREAMRAKLQDRLKRIDTNGDGLVQVDEAPEPLRAHFETLDANGDGALSPEEMKQFRPRRMRQPEAGAAQAPAASQPSSATVIEN